MKEICAYQIISVFEAKNPKPEDSIPGFDIAYTNEMIPARGIRDKNVLRFCAKNKFTDYLYRESPCDIFGGHDIVRNPSFEARHEGLYLFLDTLEISEDPAFLLNLHKMNYKTDDRYRISLNRASIFEISDIVRLNLYRYLEEGAAYNLFNNKVSAIMEYEKLRIFYIQNQKSLDGAKLWCIKPLTMEEALHFSKISNRFSNRKSYAYSKRVFCANESNVPMYPFNFNNIMTYEVTDFGISFIVNRMSEADELALDVFKAYRSREVYLNIYYLDVDKKIFHNTYGDNELKVFPKDIQILGYEAVSTKTNQIIATVDLVNNTVSDDEASIEDIYFDSYTGLLRDEKNNETEFSFDLYKKMMRAKYSLMSTLFKDPNSYDNNIIKGVSTFCIRYENVVPIPKKKVKTYAEEDELEEYLK